MYIYIYMYVYIYPLELLRGIRLRGAFAGSSDREKIQLQMQVAGDRSPAAVAGAGGRSSYCRQLQNISKEVLLPLL